MTITPELAQFILDEVQTGSRLYGRRVTDRLYGPHAANARQAIMQRILAAPIAKSKCGAGYVRKTLIDLFGIGPDCIATQDAKLQDAIESFALQLA